MSSDSESESNSPDSRPSNFNDGIGADVLETQSDSESRVSQVSSWWLKSARSTPDSHIAECPGPTGYGQGAPAYSCGCYRWNEQFKPLPLEQVYDLLILCLVILTTRFRKSTLNLKMRYHPV